MKIWKKLMAAALVAALSVLMLTACDGEIMTKDPHTLIQWTQECAKAQGVTLEENNELSEGYYQILDYNKQIYNINFNGAEGSIIDLTHARQAVEARVLDGRQFTTIDFNIPDDTGMLGKISFKTEMNQWMKMYINDLDFTPRKIGAVIFTWPTQDASKKGQTQLIIVITD